MGQRLKVNILRLKAQGIGQGETGSMTKVVDKTTRISSSSSILLVAMTLLVVMLHGLGGHRPWVEVLFEGARGPDVPISF
jgi:hypothetical protein